MVSAKNNANTCAYHMLEMEIFCLGVNETEVSVIITSHELMPKLRNILDKIPKVKTIVYFQDQLHKTDTKGFENIKIVSYDKVLELGTKNKVQPVPPSKNDTAIIMYTSGSTGIPKVLIFFLLTYSLTL
jgi:long-chain acyl-CoA synthetase